MFAAYGEASIYSVESSVAYVELSIINRSSLAVCGRADDA